MTYANSLEKRIAEQAAELQRVMEAVDDVADTRRADEEWSVNEILLHLIGNMQDVTAGLKLALTEQNPILTGEQRGGEYLNAPIGQAKDDLLQLLLSRLDQISDAVHGLDDDALDRRVTIVGEDGQPLNNVPAGLSLRYAIGDHFDTHLDQIRQALAQTTLPTADGSDARAI